MKRFIPAIAVFIAACGAVSAAEPTPAPLPPELVEVTATRVPDDPLNVPAGLTVISGEEIERRGARRLSDVLAFAAGVDIAPLGDGGPAAPVPALWGLKEFDAFLLVVDGVPWGGAFNPALSSLSLDDVERVEVLRGPAPVMYGATSFVGVIHVVHRDPSRMATGGRVTVGNHGSRTLSFGTPLSASALRSAVDVDLERRGFDDPRTNFDRAQVTFRNLADVAGGHLSFDLRGAWIRQDPASPHVREGRVLTDRTPLDANYNPLGAHINERRIALDGRFTRSFATFDWESTVSLARSDKGVLRGFLTDLDGEDVNANGFRQSIRQDDLFVDSHVVLRRGAARIVAGADLLWGKGDAFGGDFDYFAPLSGTGVPSGDDLASAAAVSIGDKRTFGGLYAQVDWNPHPRWHVEAGARLNSTRETRTIDALEFESGDTTSGRDSKTVTRGSGAFGLAYSILTGPDTLNAFANVRSTFKPAAIDFGLDSDIRILAPETATSYEAGLKSRAFGGRLDASFTLFQLDFENLVLSATQNGTPVLVNGGSQRFRGIELEAGLKVTGALLARAAFSVHDARFMDYVREFDPGVPTQLRGNRLEMSPRELASLGLLWSPEHGFTASAGAHYTGKRFLNMRNTSVAEAYTTYDAGFGWRDGKWEVRLEGLNLGDRRDPVAESELGDAQYYRLPGRSVQLALNVRL